MRTCALCGRQHHDKDFQVGVLTSLCCYNCRIESQESLPTYKSITYLEQRKEWARYRLNVLEAELDCTPLLTEEAKDLISEINNLNYLV
jgi:hypothetical protein